MKTTLMNILKIACAGLMLLFMTPAAHAGESALMNIPYGIEFGKPLSAKVERRMKVMKRWKSGHTKYIMPGKFIIDTKNDRVVSFDISSTDDEGVDTSVPKRWAKLGIRMCTKNQKGASFETMMAMAKEEGGKNINVRKVDDGVVLGFQIGNKYRYGMWFIIKEVEWCKGGLGEFGISEGDGEDY